MIFNRILRYTIAIAISGVLQNFLLPIKAQQPTSVINASLEGIVRDSLTKEPLEGVTVQLAQVTHSVKTDRQGKFRFVTGQEFPVKVYLSFIGYESKTEIISSSQAVIELNPSAADLDEVVIVGYGTQRKLSVTNAISQIGSEDISRRPVGSIAQALQGVAPGVTIQDMGGRPGNNDVNIRFRGLTTLSGNNPLIIVDGVEQTFANINPNDIETISLLKDASGTAIYGSRAANGVILVTTKRGKEGRLKINYDGYFALQDVTNRPEHIGLEEYFRLENIAYANAGRAEPYTEEYIQDYLDNAPSPAYPLPYSYWDRDQGILKITPTSNNSFALSGGGESLKTRISYRNRYTDGVISNVDDRQNDFRVNVDGKVSDKLKISADINARLSRSTQPSDGVDKIFQYMLHASKFAWPQYETGEYGLGPQTNNPLVFAELSGLDVSKNNYLLGNIKGDFEILPKLNFSLQYAIRYNGYYDKNFSNSYENTDPINGRMVKKQTNSLTETRDNLQENTLNALLSYDYRRGNLGLNALAGYSTVANTENQLTGYRENFYNNDVNSISQGSETNKDVTGDDSEYSLRSYFARINLSADDRYFFEGNIRYDGSSRFSKEKRYSLFPSFSAGWRLSEEAFWKNIRPVVNEFKLRASWGKTGNQNIDLYTYYQTLSTLGYSFDDVAVSGYAQSDFANDQLTWETVVQTDIGLDARFLNNTLGLTVDLYDKKTKDILLQLPIPALIGLNAPYQNAGVVSNKGVELGLTYGSTVEDLRYSISLNAAYNKNKVVNLEGTGPYITGSLTGPRFIIQEGLPINSHWGYLTDGFFQTTESLDYPTLYTDTSLGDVKYLDLNEDGKIDADDNTYLASSFPKYDFGGQLGLSYKNIGLHLQWQGAAGHKTRLDGAFQQIATYETFTHAIYSNNYWTPEHTDARFPRPIKGSDRNYQTSDIQLIDASYLRLKNIEVSYTLGHKLISGIGLESARIFGSATNLLTFSDLNEWDLDPEISSGRGQYYPQLRTYTVGFNLVF